MCTVPESNAEDFEILSIQLYKEVILSDNFNVTILHFTCMTRQLDNLAAAESSTAHNLPQKEHFLC